MFANQNGTGGAGSDARGGAAAEAARAEQAARAVLHGRAGAGAAPAAHSRHQGTGVAQTLRGARAEARGDPGREARRAGEEARGSAQGVHLILVIFYIERI